MTRIKVSEHCVLGENVTVWHPTKESNAYQISMKEGGWLCGAYETIEAALIGAEFDLKLNPKFYELQKSINHFDKGNRNITVKDLEQLR